MDSNNDNNNENGVEVAEAIIRRISPDIRVFIYSSIRPDDAEDAMQEVLKAVALNLKKFQGDTEKEFWAWCYRISRNKLSDFYRKEYAAQTVPVEPEELYRLMEVSAQTRPMTAGVRHDLDHIIKLLTATRPQCAKLLWDHFVVGLDYNEIAEFLNEAYDTVRMRVTRCLEDARALAS
jgi:RNA polymerase sigma factor (sigma-70 family)